MANIWICSLWLCCWFICTLFYAVRRTTIIDFQTSITLIPFIHSFDQTEKEMQIIMKWHKLSSLFDVEKKSKFSIQYCILTRLWCGQWRIQNALSGHNYCAQNYTTAYGMVEGKNVCMEYTKYPWQQWHLCKCVQYCFEHEYQHKDQNVCVEDSCEQLNGRCKWERLF